MSQANSNATSDIGLGPISLVVRDLDLMLDFYVGKLRLKVKRLGDRLIELRSNEKSPEPLLMLRHDAKAEGAPNEAAGLYHYALLVPDRASLAATYLALGRNGVLFDGHADHVVSEALYLTDPEGNGIEICADRARDEWKFDEDGRVQMGTLPLDVDSLLREVTETLDADLVPIAEGTRIGHMHLKVADLDISIQFYRQVLGLNLMSYYGSAAFLSVGGYHHIGMNTWESLGGPARKAGWSGLESFTVRIPEKQASELSATLMESHSIDNMDSGRFSLSDPDGIELLIRSM